MTNYQLTIGYKAILHINVKAESEKEAKEIALTVMNTVQDRINKTKNVELGDDNYKVGGIIDMDETWNMLQS